ncbi:hypothetical protein HK100_008019 [Physocladia obscura]|uniref:Flavoprotein domain-containing protein n=1 Tax=Physocladia obscura TaxID=109957 RepID=A0AAD5T5D8_9FUNG|nr:hypothetical protein HK100_008019 [Physocladia obscura]
MAAPQTTATTTTTNILVLATGSVAAVKVPALVGRLVAQGHVAVKVVATAHALHFFDAAQLTAQHGVAVLTEADEWAWARRADPVLHVELRSWAHAALVAPLDANSLAKAAGGLCDNLLTCVLRAWDPARPVLVAPAMNSFMWAHPLTARHLHTVQSLLNYKVIPPIEKLLACGDFGIGAMAEVDDIVKAVLDELNISPTLPEIPVATSLPEIPAAKRQHLSLD